MPASDDALQTLIARHGQSGRYLCGGRLLAQWCWAFFAGMLAPCLISVQAADLTVVPDPSFGDGGFVADHLGNSQTTDDSFRNLTVDREGRPVGVGNTAGQRFVAARYTLAGRADTTFAKTGKVAVCLEPQEMVGSAMENDRERIQFAHGAAVDSKGRILVIGKTSASDAGRVSDFAMLRFADDGSLDKSFNKTGFLKFQADDDRNIGLAIAATSDSSALVAAGYAMKGKGTRDPLLVRLSEDGTVDQRFTATAKASLRNLIRDHAPVIATAVAIDGQGRYLISLSIKNGVGSSWGVARLKSDGAIDESFAAAGLWNEPLDPAASEEAPYSVAIDEAGRIVLGGLSANAKEFRRLTVARLEETGKLDRGFGAGGKGFIILEGYGANLTSLYGPRAAVWKSRIAITGAIAVPSGKRQFFGLAVFDNDGKSVGKLAPRAVPGSKGSDLPWGVGFDASGRVLVGGTSSGANGTRRFAVARFVVR